MFQKMTEKVNYTISVKATALFATIQWSNHLRNPTSPRFENLASELENALDQVMARYPGYKFSKIIQFAADESQLKSRSSASTESTFGAYVRFIMIFHDSQPRGKDEKMENKFKNMLNGVEDVWRKKKVLDSLPGTVNYQITSRFEDHNGCQVDEYGTNACLNSGICVDLAGDFTCRCKMENYGKRCQHTKFGSKEIFHSESIQKINLNPKISFAEKTSLDISDIDTVWTWGDKRLPAEN